jgi:hypothetical protein
MGQAIKKKRGRPRKNEACAEAGHQEAISPGPNKGSVADEEAGRCLDPEGNGVNPGGGSGEGPGPPGGRWRWRQHSYGATRKTGRESGVMKRSHRAQRM